MVDLSVLYFAPLFVCAVLSCQERTDIDYNAITLIKVFVLLLWDNGVCLSFGLCQIFVIDIFMLLFFMNSVWAGLLDDIFNISQYWRSRKYSQPNSWLESWMRREIQALIQVTKLIRLVVCWCIISQAWHWKISSNSVIYLLNVYWFTFAFSLVPLYVCA